MAGRSGSGYETIACAAGDYNMADKMATHNVNDVCINLSLADAKIGYELKYI